MRVPIARLHVQVDDARLQQIARAVARERDVLCACVRHRGAQDGSVPEVASRELTSRIDQFTANLTTLAREIVRRLFEDELRSRVRGATGRPDSTRRTKGKSRAPRGKRLPNGTQTAQLAQPRHPDPRRSGSWTRDAVLDELSKWLLDGTTDAAFISRHGRKGLATAAKRIFGRFDAALNAANLRIAKQHPAGIPTTNAARARVPALRRGANGGR